MEFIPKKFIPKQREWLSLKVAMMYVLLGSSWIYFSDKLMGTLAADPQSAVRISLIKGLMYILVTAALLFFIIHKGVLRIQRSEEAIRETATRLENTLESISDAFFSMDDNLVVTYFNAPAERMLNRKATEVIGKYLFDAFPEAKGSIFDEKYHYAVTEKASVAFEAYFDIAPYRNWYEVRIYPQKKGISVYFQIITERKQAEERLRKSEQRFFLAMEATKDGLWDWDLHTDEVYYSPGYLAMLGYTPGEVPADASVWADRIHPEDKDAALKANMDCIENRRDDFDVEFRMQAKNGEWRWILGRGKAAGRDESGRAIRMVGTHTDITERKLAEIALRESEERFSRFFHANPMASSISRLSDGQFVDANDAFLDLFGYTREEVIGQTSLKLGTWANPGERTKAIEILQKHGRAKNFETQRIRKSGEIIDVLGFGEVIDIAGEKYILSLAYDITERKLAEENLKERDEFLTAVVENIPDMIFVKDAKELRFVRFNRAAEDLLGYSRDNMIGKTDHDIFPKDIADFFTRNDREVLGKKTLKDIPEETISTRLNGTRILHTKKIPILSKKKGEPKYLLGISEDITERKQMEEAIKKRLIALTRPLDSNEIEFEELFDIEEIQKLQDQFANATGVASIITNVDGTPITKPSSFCRLCETIIRRTEKGLRNCYYSDSVIGRCNPEGPIIQPCLSGGLWDAGASITVGGRHVANWLIGQVRDETQDEDQMREYARAIGIDEETFIDAFREVPSMSKDQFEKIAQALFTLAGQLSSMAYQNVQQARFITERKQAEEELVRLATAIEHAGEGIIILDTNFNIQYANPAFKRITGYEGNQIVGRHASILKSGKHEESLYQNLRETLKRGEGWSGRFINKKKDGILYHADVTASAIRDNSGAIINYVSIHRDITKEVELEKELRQAQKMEAIGNFSGGIAHDFNNILAAIMGFTELSLSKVPEGSPVRSNLEQVLKATMRASGVVRQILAFSRQSEQERKPMALAPVIQEVLKLMRSTLPTTIRINQELTTGSEEDVVLADPTQIHQVLMNLCSNAAHAMRAKGGILSVELSKITDLSTAPVHPDLTDGQYVCLTVSDTGHGMEAAVLDRIFDPYFTTKGPGEGTGLGLSVVQGIVKSHGGVITARSEPGKGTSFYILLPSFNKNVELEIAAIEPIPTGTERILLVDDEEGLAELGEGILESLGYTVTAKTSSFDALEIFQAQPHAFDLVITDMTMPDLTGTELAEMLLGIRSDLPIILCTGFTDLTSEKQAQDAGIREFIMKPYDIRTLAKAIRKALGTE
ncbi:putative Histidine kinase [Syntrophobacter sp. SbD1]|nr:putative Histidine kinase [Syntrophobacter sp. SbD1]